MSAERKYVEIDMLRGIAILMVILVHTSQMISMGSGRLKLLTSYGQMGVQLFFVASAFTLCNSWAARSAESRPVLKYFIRRFFRIAPLYYFGIVFFAAVSAVYQYLTFGVLSVAEQYTTKNVMMNLFLLHGFHPAANNNIVPGGWSIGTEVAFYCLFPLLFAASRNLGSSWRSAVCALLGVIAVSAAAVATACEVYGESFVNNGFVYFNIATQLPVFAIGMAVFWISSRWPVRSAWANGAAFIALTAFCLLFFRHPLSKTFYLVPILSALSFVFLFHVLRGNALLTSSRLARVGQLSYSMYLFHTLFAHKLSHEVAPYLQQHFSALETLAICFIFAVMGTVAIALLSEQLLEARSIAAGRWLVQRIRTAETSVRHSA